MLSLATSTIKLAATFLTNQQQHQQQQQQPQKHQLDGDLVQYSLAQVALHSSSHDCWIIIRDKVYDVTSYVSQVRFFRDSSIRCWHSLTFWIASGRIRYHNGARRKRRHAGLPGRPSLGGCHWRHGGSPDRHPSRSRTNVHQLQMNFVELDVTDTTDTVIFCYDCNNQLVSTRSSL